MKDTFFQEQLEQSEIKSRIVSKYFTVWSNIMLMTQKKSLHHSQKMAYIDLFAGPGKYDDECQSTPLMVLETIISNPQLSDRVVTIFNDKNTDSINSLKHEINQLAGISRIKNQPQFYNLEVGDEIAELFRNTNLVPTFFFIDPWGYKGLSLKLVSSFIKDWGSDGLFFFNYNRVNMGINNDKVSPHMISLFGEERFAKLQKEFEKEHYKSFREATIIDELSNALKDHGCRYILPFRFKNTQDKRTSHHLFFVTKHFKGYDKMKEIMYDESTSKKDKVASFEYNHRDFLPFKRNSLLDCLSRPLEDLKNMLIQKYNGQTIFFEQLYPEHSVNTPFIRINYKEVLRKMYDDKIITAINHKTKKPPKKGTFSNDMLITFKGVL